MNLLQKRVAVILLLLTLGAAGTVVAGPRAVERPLVAQQSATLNPRRVSALTLLGEVRIPSGGTVLGTPFGGLSGLTYNPGDGTYTAISDDRSQRAPARFYHLAIDLADGRLSAGDVTVTAVVTLTNQAGQTFPTDSLDPEGIARTPDDSYFISSEGNAAAKPPVMPWVAEFDAAGRWLREMPLPAHFLPGPGVGVRNNLAFEPLAVSPDGNRLFTATENALLQDGPAASFEAGSRSRFLAWDLVTGTVALEHVYPVASWPVAPNPATASADNGFVDLVALDDAGSFVTLERSFATGVGVTARLFETSAAGATDVSALAALLDPVSGAPVSHVPMTKRRLADIGQLGIVPDNLEGMTFGPTLPDGRRILMLVSDDNFSATQVTQFVALAVGVEAAAARRCYLPLGYTR